MENKEFVELWNRITTPRKIVILNKKTIYADGYHIENRWYVSFFGGKSFIDAVKINEIKSIKPLTDYEEKYSVF
ncbi:MAG: hypothetical protein QXH07_05835 [Thermoplasmata archaeon]